MDIFKYDVKEIYPCNSNNFYGMIGIELLKRDKSHLVCTFPQIKSYGNNKIKELKLKLNKKTSFFKGSKTFGLDQQSSNELMTFVDTTLMNHLSEGKWKLRKNDSKLKQCFKLVKKKN